MKNFEGIFILKPTLKENKINEIIEELTKECKKIEKIEKIGIKQLAYSVKNHKKGYFIEIYFTDEEIQAQEMKLIAQNNDNIIKFIIIRN